MQYTIEFDDTVLPEKYKNYTITNEFRKLNYGEIGFSPIRNEVFGPGLNGSSGKYFIMKKKVWYPKVGEFFHFVTRDCLTAVCLKEDNDLNYWSDFNGFKTQEDAIRAAQLVRETLTNFRNLLYGQI